MGKTRTIGGLLIGMSAIVGAAGCGGGGVQVKGVSHADGAGGNLAAFVPVRVRVHPLTSVRSAREPGTRQIEAHIELFDRWDHPVKALGTVVLELYREAGVGSAGDIGGQAARWDYEMTDPDVNARAYDPVTRTYRFLLNDRDEVLRADAEWTLRVLFTRPDGVSLSGEGAVRAGGGLSRQVVGDGLGGVVESGIDVIGAGVDLGLDAVDEVGADGQIAETIEPAGVVGELDLIHRVGVP